VVAVEVIKLVAVVVQEDYAQPLQQLVVAEV
jgi:hypothetical protein